jgi:hypothetical protein
VLLVLTLAVPEAWGRAYVTENFEGYTVRCSAVPSIELPSEVLNRYRIDADDGTGVLSCVVQQQQADGSYTNVRADVTAAITNLVGIVEGSPVREVLQGDNVTYIATYDIPNENPLTFDLVIEPEASRTSIPIQFEDIRPAQ